MMRSYYKSSISCNGRSAYRIACSSGASGLDDNDLEDLKEDLIYAKQLAVDEDGRVLVWTGASEAMPPPAFPPGHALDQAPLTYTPPHLTEKILASRAALEGERKQVTILFADLKDSTELIRDLDPEAAQQLLDPALRHMMEAVHRYEGTVNQVLGDGIMALFGAPIAHEDHALRACYAALAMQAAMRGVYRGGAARPWPRDAHPGGTQLRRSGGPGHRQRPAHGLLGGRSDDASGGAHGTTGDAGQRPADRSDPQAGRGLGPSRCLGPGAREGPGRARGGIRTRRRQRYPTGAYKPQSPVA